MNRKIVIEIDEGYYKAIKESESAKQDIEPWSLIAKGAPLPKGHDDLISRQAVLDLYPIPPRKEWTKQDSRLHWVMASREMICELPTIIKADKEGEYVDDIKQG